MLFTHSAPIHPGNGRTDIPDHFSTMDGVCRTRACPHPERRPHLVTDQKWNFSPESGEPFFTYHPQLFWWPRAHINGTFWSTPDVRANEFGLREKALDLSLAKRNVLLVGDSVLWGYLIREEERFSNVFQRRLSSSSG